MKRLTEHEKTTFSDLMQGMTEEELDTSIRAIPMDELSREVARREDLALQTIDRVAEVVLTVTNESTYKDIMSAIKLIHTLTSLSDI